MAIREVGIPIGESPVLSSALDETMYLKGVSSGALHINIFPVEILCGNEADTHCRAGRPDGPLVDALSEMDEIATSNLVCARGFRLSNYAPQSRQVAMRRPIAPSGDRQ